MKNEKRNWLPWLVLVGTIIVRGFATGLNTVSSLFLAPVSKELGTGIGTLSIYYSIISVVQIIWFSYAGRLFNKYDVRWVSAAAVCLQTIAYAALGFMRHVTGWYVLAIPLAMGAGVLVNLLGPILVNRWFDKNTGTILGIQAAFVGLFGAVLQPVTSNMIEVKGWRETYFSMGLLALCVMLLAATFFIRNRPVDPLTNKNIPSEKKDADENQSNRDRKVKNSSEELQGKSKTATRSAAFYALIIFLFAVTGVAVFVQHIPTYGTLLGYSMASIGMVLSLASIGNAIGSFFIGFLSDRIGGLKTCYLIIGIWLTAVVGFVFGGSHFMIFMAAAFLNGLVTPSMMVTAPILTEIFFGKSDYEKIYAKVSTGVPLASIFLIPIYGFIYDMTGNYLIVLFILIILLLLAGASIAYGWKHKQRRNESETNLQL